MRLEGMGRYRWILAGAIGTAVLVGSAVPATAADEPLRFERLPASKVLRAEERPTSPEARSSREIELGVSHPERLRRQKARAAREAEESSGASSSAAVSGTLNQPGLVAAGSTPPDSTGAIGPDHYLEMVNTRIGVFDRTDLSLDGFAELDEFVGDPGEEVFDPQIQWDAQADRWLYVADDVVNANNNFLAYGWSMTPDPTDLENGWCHFLIDSPGTQFDDYPKLGHSNDFIIIGTNAFANSGDGGFVGSRVWAIDKPDAGVTTCTEPDVFASSLPLLDANGRPAFTPVPANTFESSTNGYVAAAEDPFEAATPNQITAWHVEPGPDPLNDPVLVEDGAINVGAFGIPANVPQPGTGGVLDSLDARLTQAVARTDPAAGEQAVWTQHTVNGPGNRSVARWYELLPDAGTARQRGTISDPSQFVFNAAISPTDGGTSAVIDHNVGGASLLAQIRAYSRQGSTPLNQMGGATTLGTSAASARDFTCTEDGGPCRWGDYAGASPDPVNPGLVWGSNQTIGPAAGLAPRWRTRNFALTTAASPPSTAIDSGPAQGSTIDDPSPAFGFSSNDPSANFRCRVDGSAFSACRSPTTIGPLPNGEHAFAARATGGGGMVDPTPASRSFTIDAPGPTTTITKGPKGKKKTKKKRFKAKFRFTASDPALGDTSASDFAFECKLDGKGWKTCTSPRGVKVKAKSRAKRHRFRVRATNELRTTGPEAKRKFKLKRKRRR